MNRSLDGFLLWTPRVLCLVFASFVSLFALDAFESGRGFWANLLAFAIHLIPTYMVLAVVALGWRRPTAAGLVMIAAGLFYAFWTPARSHVSWILAMSGPACLTGALFLLSPLRRRGPDTH